MFSIVSSFTLTTTNCGLIFAEYPFPGLRMSTEVNDPPLKLPFIFAVSLFPPESVTTSKSVPLSFVTTSNLRLLSVVVRTKSGFPSSVDLFGMKLPSSSGLVISNTGGPDNLSKFAPPLVISFTCIFAAPPEIVILSPTVYPVPG